MFLTVMYLRLIDYTSYWVVVVFQNPPIPVYRGYVVEPAAAYPEHHLPTYSSVCPPVVTQHSRHSPRSFGYDVCDSSADDSRVANVR